MKKVKVKTVLKDILNEKITLSSAPYFRLAVKQELNKFINIDDLLESIKEVVEDDNNRQVSS